MIVSDITVWVEGAAPGESLTYHQGLLGIDRAPGSSSLPDAHRTTLDRIAGHAMALAENGRVLLVQRRLGVDRIAYLAVKVSDDKPRRI